MHEQRLKDLIELELDGLATPAERAELEQQLENEPHLRRSRDEMMAVHQLLDARPHVAPPESLREQIAESVREAAHSADPPVAIFAAGADKRRRIRRFAFAVAAVLVVAIVLGPSLTRNIDIDQLGGTMAPAVRADGSWNHVPLDGEEIRGAVLTQSMGRELIVRLELEAPRPERLEVTFDPDQLRLSTVVGANQSSIQESGHLVADLDGKPPELRFERLTEDPVALSLNIRGGSAATSLEIVFP